jgi:hypothetical protein
MPISREEALKKLRECGRYSVTPLLATIVEEAIELVDVLEERGPMDLAKLTGPNND